MKIINSVLDEKSIRLKLKKRAEQNKEYPFSFILKCYNSNEEQWDLKLFSLRKILPCRLWSLGRQRRSSRPSGADNDGINIGTEIGRNYGSSDAGDGWRCSVNHVGHGDSHTVGWILSMVRRDRCCRSGRRFRREITLMMMRRGLLLRMVLRMMVRMLLLWLLLLLVIGHWEFGRIVTGGAGIYRAVVTIIVHLDAETLELLSGVSLHRVGLLEARQGCRTASKKSLHFIRLVYFANIVAPTILRER